MNLIRWVPWFSICSFDFSGAPMIGGMPQRDGVRKELPRIALNR